MAKYFLIIVFLSTHLVPEGINTFEVIFSPIDNGQKSTTVYRYMPEKKQWQIAEKGVEEGQRVVKLKGTKANMVSPQAIKVNVLDYLVIEENINWEAVEEIPFQRHLSNLEGPMLISRDSTTKKIYFKQEKGVLSQVGTFEISW